MNSLRVATQQQKTSFTPGEEVTGAVSWSLDREPKSAVVRLFWYTEGKGTRDVGVVAEEQISTPRQKDERSFRFTLPAAPYTFSGKLISLLWAIELVIEPGDLSERLPIVVSPTGEEILLSGTGKQVVA